MTPRGREGTAFSPPFFSVPEGSGLKDKMSPRLTPVFAQRRLLLYSAPRVPPAKPGAAPGKEVLVLNGTLTTLIIVCLFVIAGVCFREYGIIMGAW